MAHGGSSRPKYTGEAMSFSCGVLWLCREQHFVSRGLFGRSASECLRRCFRKTVKRTPTVDSSHGRQGKGREKCAAAGTERVDRVPESGALCSYIGPFVSPSPYDSGKHSRTDKSSQSCTLLHGEIWCRLLEGSTSDTMHTCSNLVKRDVCLSIMLIRGYPSSLASVCPARRETYVPGTTTSYRVETVLDDVVVGMTCD